MSDGDEDFDRFIASFAGIDGGNRHADLWICGIEHGGELEKPGSLLEPERRPGSWTQTFKEKPTDFYRWQYHQKVAKLLIALDALSNAPAATPDISPQAYRPFMADKLYAKDGQNFKLNLFPLASPSVNSEAWRQAYRGHPYLEEKSSYYGRCREKRFPFLRRLRAKYRPNVVIGTGITFKEDFAKAFGFEGPPEELALEPRQSSTRSYFRYEDATGVLYVTPFFGGRYGLNSNALIVELARHLAMAHPELGKGGGNARCL